MGSLPALLRKGYHIRALALTAILGIPLLPSICPWSINQLRQIDSAVKVILHAAAIESGTQVALLQAQNAEKDLLLSSNEKPAVPQAAALTVAERPTDAPRQQLQEYSPELKKLTLIRAEFAWFQVKCARLKISTYYKY